MLRNILEVLDYKPIIQTIKYNGLSIGVLRLDLIHLEISGNKWFKLKLNLQEATIQNKTTILTFGGAFSNHIAATASACKLFNFKSIGVIRGEKESALNSTLSVAQQNGMKLLFVDRATYSKKNDADYLLELQTQYPEAYIIPEGGDNELGQKGCASILTSETICFDTVFCAYGTGTTFNGIANALQSHQQVIGINVLKYDAQTNLKQRKLVNEYHFGGYAKHTAKLLEFKYWFENEYAIPLDYVYTAKLFFAVFDLINQHKINTTQQLLIIHSGGLQGNNGYESRYHLANNLAR